MFLHFYPTKEETLEKTAHLQLLADEYANAIPENRYPVAILQGYLMQYKDSPEQAAKNIGDWIETFDGKAMFA